MPFMSIGGLITDVGGNFEVASGSATFEGPYLKINDNCGSSSLPVSGIGIDWGASGGTDCKFCIRQNMVVVSLILF